jgi:hypothetical protein
VNIQEHLPAVPFQRRGGVDSQQEFQRALREQYPQGFTAYHETPIENAEHIRQTGLNSNESAEATNFFTIGKPGGFITSSDKAIVQFKVHPKDYRWVGPDQRYVGKSSDPHDNLLREHQGVFGADAALAGHIPPHRLLVQEVRGVS